MGLVIIHIILFVCEIIIHLENKLKYYIDSYTSFPQLNNVST